MRPGLGSVFGVRVADAKTGGVLRPRPFEGLRTLGEDQRLRLSARLASPMSELREASRWTSRSRARESSWARIGFMTPMLCPSTSSSVARLLMTPSPSTPFAFMTCPSTSSSSVARLLMTPSPSIALRLLLVIGAPSWPGSSSSPAACAAQDAPRRERGKASLRPPSCRFDDNAGDRGASGALDRPDGEDPDDDRAGRIQEELISHVALEDQVGDHPRLAGRETHEDVPARRVEAGDVVVVAREREAAAELVDGNVRAALDEAAELGLGARPARAIGGRRRSGFRGGRGRSRRGLNHGRIIAPVPARRGCGDKAPGCPYPVTTRRSRSSSLRTMGPSSPQITMSSIRAPYRPAR